MDYSADFLSPMRIYTVYLDLAEGAAYVVCTLNNISGTKVSLVFYLMFSTLSGMVACAISASDSFFLNKATMVSSVDTASKSSGFFVPLSRAPTDPLGGVHYLQKGPPANPA